MFKFTKKSKFVLFALLLIVASLENVFLAEMMRRAFSYIEKGSIHLLLLLIVVLFIGYLILMVGTAFYHIVQNNILAEITYNIRNDIFNNEISFINKKNSGTSLSFILNDLKLLETNYLERIFENIFQAVLCVFSLVYAFYVSWQVTLIIIFFSVLSYFIPKLFEKSINKKGEKWSEANQQYTVHTKEAYGAKNTLISYGINKIIVKMNKKFSKDLSDSNAQMKNTQAIANTTVSYISLVGYFSAIFFGAIFVVKDAISLGDLMGAVQAGNTIIVPLIIIYSNFNAMSATKTINKNYEEIVKYNKKLLDINHNGNEQIAFKNKINLENIHFNYDERSLLKIDELNINKNEKILIIGPSGSGKTTLINLLNKSIIDYDGQIQMDEEDYLNIQQRSFSELSVTIGQSIFIFDDTVSYNVSLGANYTEEEIKDSLMKAGLESFINERGLDYKLGENGAHISGGQKQRIEIARAFLRNRKLIFMDEGTSSLDPNTSKDIEELLLTQKDLTVVISAHKISREHIDKFDKVIILSEGEEVEIGTVAQFKADADSFLNTVLIG